MFLFKLEKFIPNDPADVQIGTTFELSLSKTFDSLLHTQKVELPGDILKYMYDFALDPDTTYYVRAKRHFAESNLDHYSPTKIVRYDKTRAEAVIFNRENKVVKPWINFDIDMFHDPNVDNVNISTSAFKATMSGHEYTHWIITDGIGELLFSSIEDKENKTSISIKKTSDLTTKNILRIYAIHGSSLGVESEVGFLELDLQKFNFEVTSKTDNIPIGDSYKLSLRRITSSREMKVSKVEILDNVTNKILYSIINTKEDENIEFTLPWYLFRYNTVTKVLITALNNNGVIGHKIVHLKTVDSGIRELEELEYTYNNEVKVIGRLSEEEYTNGVISMELPNNIIPLPIRNSNKLYKYKFNHTEQRLVKTNESLKGITLLSQRNNDIYIKYTENNLLVIDGWRDLADLSRVPVFLVYRHNTHTDTYTLLNMIEHPVGDNFTVAKNNSLVQVTEDKFIYKPHKQGKLYEIDIVKGTCVEKHILPNPSSNNHEHELILSLPRGRYLINTGDDTFTYKYDITKDTFEKSITIMPMSFTTTTSISRTLPNGDVLVTKTSPLMGDDDKSVLVYSYRNKKFTQVDIKYEHNEYPDGSILLLNNELLLTKRVVNADPMVGDINILYKYL